MIIASERISLLAPPEDAMLEMTEGFAADIRFNTVAWTGVPGFIPRAARPHQTDDKRKRELWMKFERRSIAIGLRRT
jgi:hypothetical protein